MERVTAVAAHCHGCRPARSGKEVVATMLESRLGRPLMTGLALFATLTCSLAVAAVDPAVVSAVIAYGRDNLDDTSGLVRDATRQPNVAESSPGYLAAMLIEGGHDAAVGALVDAIVANQDRETRSATRGYFRWHGSGGYSYDATLYVLPVLSWCARHHQRALGSRAGALTDAIRLGVDALDGYSFEPQDEAYTMLQAAARASAGAALDDARLISRARTAVDKWLNLVAANGLPEGHSPSFDAMRLAALYWVSSASAETSPALETAIRLARADGALRVWRPHNVLAGPAYHSFMSDYTASGGLSAYLCRGYFGTGPLDNVEPFVMHFLLPAPPAVQPTSPDVPYTVRTIATSPGKVQGTCTHLAPEFALSTMSGKMTGTSLPMVLRFADPAYPEALAATVFPAEGHVSSVQQDGTALCAIHFDRIGVGTRRQAYVSLRIGRRDQIDEVFVRRAAWNMEDTGIDQREAFSFSMAGCYVGIVIGRCGPVEGDTVRRVKPGELRWAGVGPLERLQLDVYGRQSDFSIRQPLNDVRVTLGVHVAPASAYPSLEDFDAELARSRISEKVEQIRQRLEEPSQLPTRKPTDGIVPNPQPRKDIPYRQLVQQTVTWRVAGSELQLIEDLNAGELLSTSVDGVALPMDLLWSAPGLTIPAGKGLDALRAAEGL